MAAVEPTAVSQALSDRQRVQLLWTLRVLLLVAVLATWQWYGSRPEVFAIAPFTEVASAFWDGIVSGDFLRAIGGTLASVAIGYVIAAVIGVGLGLWIGVSRYAQNTIEPLTTALYATPVSLFIPVLIVVVGLQMNARVVLIVLWCVFEIVVTTSAGVKDVSREIIDMARSFDAPRRMLYQKVILPAAMPHIVLGLRMGVARAMRGAVTAELMLAVANLGLIILEAQSRFQIPRLLSGIMLTMLLGLALMALASLVERRVLAHYLHR